MLQGELHGSIAGWQGLAMHTLQHISVHSEDKDFRSGRLRRLNLHSLRYDRASVVVSHDMLRANHHVVSGLDHLALWEVDSILLHDLLDDCLWCLWRGRTSRRK